MAQLTSIQKTVIRGLVGTLSGASRTILTGREGVGIGSVRWAGDKLAEAGLEEICMDALVMIRASIKAYGQGDDGSASSCAATASERLAAMNV